MKGYLIGFVISIIFIVALIASDNVSSRYVESFMTHGLHPSQERRVYSALIMQSIVATKIGWSKEELAKFSVERADALIAELNKKK